MLINLRFLLYSATYINVSFHKSEVVSIGNHSAVDFGGCVHSGALENRV